MEIGIIGGSLQGVLLALHLTPEHKITLFELDAEIGTPAWHPGYIIEPKILESFLSPEQLSFLMLKKNPSGWGFRWEWLMKHLTIIAAQQGVHLRTRTKIKQTSQDGPLIIVETSTNETSQPTVFTFNHLINTQFTTKKPGNHHHLFNKDHCINYPFHETIPWFGGILSSTHLPEVFTPKPNILLHRSDNLVELWWDNENYWNPPKGYIEEMKVQLPKDVKNISFDTVYNNTLEFIQTIIRT